MRTNTAVNHWRHRKPKEPIVPEPDEGEFEAEQIMDKRVSLCGRRVHYLVKWKGYPMSENTWEPPTNLVNCKELIREYEKLHGNETRYRKPTARKRNRHFSKTVSPSGRATKRQPQPLEEHKLEETEEASQNTSVSETDEVGAEENNSTMKETDEEKKKREHLEQVYTIIQMDNSTNGEIAFEAEL
ncbi:unnamed protein product [Toxocara canis]|uniref:Chromo domain-containing protein n=1 Tax=Toxocara canis TaxID=6265 RepID=A0A183UXG1_TOXCA|nr:unnamed protein product [Toxocara canis]